MRDFVAYNPTDYVFGKGTETRVGALFRSLGVKKVLVHFGGGSAVKSGLIGRVEASLDQSGLAHCALGGVKPNPRLSLVREGIELCRREGCDAILAVGGGSVIDSAKGIGIGAPYAGDVWDLYEQKAPAERMLPVGIVLTIPAAGSESSACSVVTNEDGLLKRGLVQSCMRAQFVVMNPELTYSLPPRQTAAGATDMFSHVLERYFTRTPGVYAMNRLAESILRAIMDVTPRVLTDPENYDLRGELMWIGTVAHNDTCGLGLQQDWACHHIEHELSGLYDVTHGEGLAVIIPAWMKYVYRNNAAKFAEYARSVFSVDTSALSEEEAALAGIRCTESYFRSIGMPIRLSELKIGPERFFEMAHKVIVQPHGKSGWFERLSPEDIVEIYRLAL